MVIFKHELRQNAKSITLWSVAMAVMIAVCCVIFPEMKSQMGGIDDMLANMGEFTAAFGLDRLNYAEFLGYFGVECGNFVGIGGALLASYLGISMLSKEERFHTAEFLLTTPNSRTRIVVEKLAALFTLITVFNAVMVAATALSVVAIGEDVSFGTLGLLFLAFYLMQLELAAITFGISAFISKGGIGIGVAIGALSYFLNIVANLVDETKFLKYITPFGYTESADIISDKALNGTYLAIGAVFTVIGITLAFVKYRKKDIA